MVTRGLLVLAIVTCLTVVVVGVTYPFWAPWLSAPSAKPTAVDASPMPTASTAPPPAAVATATVQAKPQVPPIEAGPLNPSADSVVIEAEGAALTRDLAISKALISAVERVSGITIATAEIAPSVVVANHSGSNQPQDTNVVEATLSLIARSSGGHILTYNVEAVTEAPEGGLLARVRVQVAVYHRRETTENRRRIAVAYFEVGSDSAASRAAFHDRLVQSLVQSRRFSVVDRSDDAVYQQEMAVISGPDTPAAERMRLGQVLGADYVITGHLKVQPAQTVGSPESSTQHTLELTGEVITNTTPSTLRIIPGSVSVDYRVTEIATRQIVLADHIDMRGSGVEALADVLSTRVTSAIYPPRIIDSSDPAALIINQGGAGISVGQRYRIMREGTDLIDPYTHELLGKKETEIGVIEISTVGDKLTYGKLLSGSVSGATETLVLRPLPTPPASVTSSPPKKSTVPVQSAPAAPAEPDTGIRLPFDH